MIKISIITPTFNRAYSLERAIDSFVNQSYENTELIICDDASSDNTKEVLLKYSDINNIKIVSNSFNGGVNVARNNALNNISPDSDFVTFLDSDDELLPDAIENMVKTIDKNPNINYFRFGTQYNDSPKKNHLEKEGLVADYQMYLSDRYAKGDWIVALNSKIIRSGFRFEERVNGFEGIAWLRLSKTENVLYDSTIVLNIYANVNDSLLRPAVRNRKYYSNIKLGIEIYLQEFESDLLLVSKKRLAERLYALGNINYILGQHKDGDRLTLRAFSLDPFNLRLVRNIISKFKRQST